ncbi:MAG TPA: hypothetical protein VN673_00145 [Clostridia bacterium]|nr:hypothetical protein [Clostridia bacterium]
MDAHELTDRFLQSVDALVGSKDGKWTFDHLKTSHGTETRNGFLDACSELFVPFIGQPQSVIYEAVRDALRRRGGNWAVQRYGGMVLLNLVPDAYGQVDELIDIVAPIFDVSNGEIPAFLVEQVGLEPVLRKIEERKKAAKDPEILSCLGGLAYQAQVYHNRKRQKTGWHEGT